MKPPPGKSFPEGPAKEFLDLVETAQLSKNYSPFAASPDKAELRQKKFLEKLEVEERQQRESVERERLTAMPPAYVIVLVHGTQLSRWFLGPLVSFLKWPRGVYSEFQDGPAWIQQHSPLAEHLTEALGWRVRIEPFSWKGYNTVAARAAATYQLRAKLCKLREDYPGAEQVIIGHSHGGNVAMSAL